MKDRVCAVDAFAYPPHNANGLSRQKAWIADFVVHDAVEYLLFIIAWKRGLDTNTRQGRRQASQFRGLQFSHHMRHNERGNGNLIVILSTKMGKKKNETRLWSDGTLARRFICCHHKNQQKQWEWKWALRPSDSSGFKLCLNGLSHSHLSHKHLIDKDPQSPPVYGSGVRCICQDFWGQKLWSPTECAGPVPKTHS